MFLRGKLNLININDNYLKIKNNYLFCEVSKKVDQFKEKSTIPVISLGIGDVSGPIDKKLLNVMRKALVEECKAKTFKGYPPEVGYKFLRKQISDFYQNQNINIEFDEVFVNNGACPDIAGILDIFKNNTAVIQNPTYPAYVDTNLLCGNPIIYVDTLDPFSFKTLENKSYLIYLCSPNNPIGITLDKSSLRGWVDFALSTNSVIVFDAAYNSFIKDDSPKSIYEIEGAKQCAIEIASLSKMAGFTGLRAGWTIVPKELVISGFSINSMWERHQTTTFNGIPYHIQKGAAFALSPKGQLLLSKKINQYRYNAQLLSDFLSSNNIEFIGGTNSPYIWAKCPPSLSSWQTFDYILSSCGVVVMPGSGFGELGEGYIRLSCFASTKNTRKAINRLQKLKL